jgi:protein gp37
MGSKSAIEWTDSSWNPATGCDPVSPACKFCYAKTWSENLMMRGNPKYRNGFAFTLQPQDLELPLKWKKPRKIFVNSMSDLFHDKMPNDYLMKICDVMKQADWHIFQILTKQPQRMLDFQIRTAWAVPDNVWLGVSVESWAFKPRIDLLRQVRAPVRFLSIEPLLDTLMDGRPAYADQPEISPGLDLTGIHWVIVGGESGQHLNNPGIAADRGLVRYVEGSWIPWESGDRTCITWVREIRDECRRQVVAFFFKQWGGPRPKSGGKILDGRTWAEYPAGAIERLNSRKQTTQVKLG